MMKIGIDARLYGTKHRGLGRYVKHLVDGLALTDSHNQYVIFLTSDNFDEFTIQSPNVKKVLLNARWYSFKEQYLVQWIIKKENLDLMHFPHFNVPFNFTGRYIVTIHDLIIDHFPDSRATTLPHWQYRLKLFLYKGMVRRAVKRAVTIIVPSEFVRQDLANIYHVPLAKIVKIHEGGDLENNQPATGLDRLKISKPFLLYVGAAYPHKNLERLVKVFQKIEPVGRYQLVLAGLEDIFYRRLATSFKTDDIILTGYLSDAELAALYQRALIFIFPSLYEGFGLPPLEAQAYGLPVVAADCSALPEVLGRGALYFNPESEAEMAEKIKSVLEDQKVRQDLIRQGQINRQRFSWQKMVLETIKLYQEPE